MNRRIISIQYLYWFWIIPFTSVRAETSGLIEAESNIGNLFLIQSQNTGVWNVFHRASGEYFSGHQSGSFCFQSECNCYIEQLTFKNTSLTTFPFGLIEQRLFEYMQTLRMTGLGVSKLDNGEIVRPVDPGRLTTLDLSHNALKYIPAHVFANLTNINEIDLSFNQISDLDSDAFSTNDLLGRKYDPLTGRSKLSFGGLQALRIIRLNNNNLTNISPNWFSSLRILEILLLNDNFISEIDLCYIFRENYALRTLHLQNNQLSSIFADNMCLNNLKSFDISNNPEIVGDGLIEVSAVTMNISYTNSRLCFISNKAVIIHADHNRINSVEIEETPNTNMRELYLHHNNIDSIDFLIELRSVEIIDLSHNALTQIKLNVLENLKNLTSLNVSYNKLVTIDFAFIKPATSLTHLDVSNNFLSGHFHLNVEAKALATLNIATNNYTSVQLNLKNHAPNLTSVDLNNNNFDCDDLTSTILFLHFDHITPIVRSDNAFGYKNNVKGIKCQQTATIGNGDSETITKKVEKGINYNVKKNEIDKSIDEKLLKLESRLTELIANSTASMRP